VEVGVDQVNLNIGVLVFVLVQFLGGRRRYIGIRIVEYLFLLLFFSLLLLLLLLYFFRLLLLLLLLFLLPFLFLLLLLLLLFSFELLLVEDFLGDVADEFLRARLE
tara:strand:- start:117 stop:434 length:318 start_codon:yes stop_codon:yes gene_type:complete